MKTKKTIIRFLALCTLVVTLGASCNSSQLPAPGPVELQVWRSEDSEDDFEAAILEYQAVYPNVSFDVRIFQEEEYEQALIDAWAKGEGPDIFSVQNWRLGKFKDLIAPMPQTATLRSAQESQGNFGRKIVVEDRNIVYPSVASLRNTYAGTVFNDVVFDEQIYGLPLSMDTLALYYNLDLLAQAQIAVPPSNWNEFLNAVQQITAVDEDRNVVRPAAGIGTAENVPHYFDLISVLMMQSGAQMVDERGRVLFNGPNPEQPERFPGIEALEFYRDFSNPAKQSFTWDAEQPSAKDVFLQGSLAFYFGYYEEKAEIEQQAPELNFSHTALPQVDTAAAVNFANYPVETVYVNSENVDHAWNFLRFMAGEERARVFAESTNRIPALLTLLDERSTDVEVEPFVAQALTATGWFRGHSPDDALEAFAQMIQEANAREQELAIILATAAKQIELAIE